MPGINQYGVGDLVEWFGRGLRNAREATAREAGYGVLAHRAPTLPLRSDGPM